jgi:NAD(P)H-dependent FMN reductase
MKIFAISGSLRAQSANTALLLALVRFAPDFVSVEIFQELERIPAFNPDRENDEPPVAVAHLREGLKAADVVVFSTPEYAHGVPGVLKNALDWVVGSGELYEKPIAILQTSATRGANALASLKATLAIMGTKLMCESVVVPDENGIFGGSDTIKKVYSELSSKVAG